MTSGFRILAPPHTVTDEELYALIESRRLRLQPLMQTFTLETLGNQSLPIGWGAWKTPWRNAQTPPWSLSGVFDSSNVRCPDFKSAEPAVLTYGISRNGGWFLVRIPLDPSTREVLAVDIAGDTFTGSVDPHTICQSIGIEPMEMLRFINKELAKYQDRLERKLRKVQELMNDFQAENKILDMWRGHR